MQHTSKECTFEATERKPAIAGRQRRSFEADAFVTGLNTLAYGWNPVAAAEPVIDAVNLKAGNHCLEHMQGLPVSAMDSVGCWIGSHSNIGLKGLMQVVLPHHRLLQSEACIYSGYAA